ncbi:MAG: transketolase C-terminal domain-containing protein, partial [Geminicoccaceae bacterium]
LEAAPEATRRSFEAAIAGELPAELPGVIDAYKRKLSAEKPAWASRKASQMALEVLTAAIPTMVGGSADLTHSNLTNTAATKPMVPGDYAGRYVSYGVREHGMMAAMNGMAVHGGIIPYGGTFLVFADYCRPSLRLAALMQQRVIFVATHDSIGLGEDGPTHQPVEHLASLRVIPNMLVFRPADAVETMECWELALRQTDGPSTLALTRQELPTLREAHSEANLCARGAYLLTDASAKRDVTILGTGSEVHIALAAGKLLAAEGINAAVVSMPSWELFDRQDPAYRASVLGDAPRVAVEAASPFGWTRYVASEADVVGMTSFGASGPIKELYEHFGLTAENVARKARALL